MTREKAKQYISQTLKGQNKITQSAIDYVDLTIDKLSCSYEAQLKDKDAEIERLKAECKELNHYKEHFKYEELTYVKN